ncbi:hypothetical protein HYFRA_00013143 [Hymenoscyphus fraxineus]|uniref:mitogen-activated protein kinase n=1 Tax=Hymenoscyphus fraxineus TaxID=746836 RepID=A0A9N9PU50_9HELO|nr:hypothetical protein HYFRA_00013143 [Hymenoscyphus fraxineus]
MASPRRRPDPDKRILFSLRPYLDNKRAKDVVAHESNHHNVSFSMSDRSRVIDVGFHLHGNSSTLATLGRGSDADIYIEGSEISRRQCSFEIDPDTHAVMLYDRSTANSTQVFGENSKPFERERDLRKVLVQKGLNTIIGMGGVGCNLVQFSLEWHRDPTETTKYIEGYEGQTRGRVENPRLARTEEEVQTEFPSPRETRIHTPEQRPLRMRYVVREKLGSGTFGTVFKAINVDSGKFMAVKIIEPPKIESQQEGWRRALKREVETFSQISHPHIVNYITAQGWNGRNVEIFMGLKEGTLESLVDSGHSYMFRVNVAESVFPQMLRALDYIAWKDIIHRDVKPENILYVSLPAGAYQFQLADFGLCNSTTNARTCAGTVLYMAPEVFQGGIQTGKVDVWSLFVTMLWILDVQSFRQRSRAFGNNPAGVQQVVLSIAAGKVKPVPQIREMAIEDPAKRASAAQMLVKLYKGALGIVSRNRPNS